MPAFSAVNGSIWIFTVEAFDIAEKYRTIVIILADGSLGQMMEPAELPEMREIRSVEERPSWALSGAKGRKPNIITSFYLDPLKEEEINRKLMAKQAEIEANEIRFRELILEDAEIVVIAFGTAGRIALSAIKTAREEGICAGLFRPISLYPFPYERVRQLGDTAKEVLVVEMNSGQMLGDVRIGIEGKIPISFYGRQGGVVPLPDEVLEEIRKIHSRSSTSNHPGE